MSVITESAGAILVAAGRSERMGQDKIWAELCGMPVLERSLRALRESCVQKIVLVVSDQRLEDARRLSARFDASVCVVQGGVRRRDSVQAGLLALPDVTWVAVHDAARPLLTPGLVDRGVASAQRTGAAIPAIAVPDTIKVIRGEQVIETLERSALRAVQTPQVFRRDLLVWALSCRADDVTDEAGLLETLGVVVRTFEGDPENFKLTYPGDIERAVSVLQSRATRKGTEWT